MKWKVSYPDGKVEYLNPEDVQLTMIGCQLKNNRKTANKIYEGENKTVCAWVVCDSLSISPINFYSADSTFHEIEWRKVDIIKYNPRLKPYWFMQGEEGNLDNKEFDTLYTLGKSIVKVYES